MYQSVTENSHFPREDSDRYYYSWTHFSWDNFHANLEWEKIITSFNYSTTVPGRKPSEFVSSCFITGMLIYRIGQFSVTDALWERKKKLLIYQVLEENKRYTAIKGQSKQTILLTCIYVLFLFWFSNTEKNIQVFCLSILGQLGCRLLVEEMLTIWKLDTNNWRGAKTFN